MADLGTRIKTMRLSRDIKQIDLAEQIGVSRSAISMYENGTRTPDYEVIEAIADVFNVPTSALLCDDRKTQEDEEVAIIRELLRKKPQVKELLNIVDAASPHTVYQIIAVANALYKTAR